MSAGLTTGSTAAAETDAAARSPISPRLIVLCLLLLTVVTFLPVLDHGFVEYDDPDYVTDNPRVRAGLSWDGVVWASRAVVLSQWYPLTVLSHMLDVELFGLDPRGHHLTSLLLHAAATALLFWVLLRMTGAAGRSAWVAAAFGVHPAHVESVAWIAERKDVLSGLLWIAGMGLYLHFARRPTVRRWVLVAVAYTLALFAKPMAVTLPLVLLLLDAWPLGRWRPLAGETTDGGDERHEDATGPGRPAPAWRLIAEKLPLLAMAAAVSVVTVHAQSAAIVPLERLSLGQRLENAVTSYAAYLGKLLWPHDLAVFYPLRADVPVWEVAGAAVLLAAVTAGALLLVRRAPYLAVGWLWYLGVLFPVNGLVQIGSHGLADRYTYLPSIGLLLALAWGAHALLAGRGSGAGPPAAGRHGRRRAASGVLGALGALSIAALAIAAHTQVKVWANSETLFRHAARVTAGNHVAHVGLGNALLDRGAPREEVLSQFRAAIAAAPERASAHGALGAAWVRWGEPERALPHLETALRLDPADPRGYHALAAALSHLGDDDRALELLQRAVELDPDFALAHRGLGALYAERGEPERSLRHYRRAYELEPDNEGLRKLLEAVGSRPAGGQ